MILLRQPTCQPKHATDSGWCNDEYSNDKTIRLWNLENGRCLAIYARESLLYAPKEIWQAFLSKEQICSNAAIDGFGNDVTFGFTVNPQQNLQLLHWQAQSGVNARKLFDDGRALATQENGQVCLLRPWLGNRRVTLEELNGGD